MNALDKNEKAERADQLLREGAATYLDALVAISAFGREVCNRCRRVVSGSLLDLGLAFGGEIAQDAIEDYESPFKHLDEGQAYLGVWIKSAFPTIMPITLFFSLCWEFWENVTWFGVYSSVWGGIRHTGKRLEKALKEARLPDDYRTGKSGTEVYIFKTLQPSEAANFESVLQDLIDQWVRIGKKCGGFLKILGEDA